MNRTTVLLVDKSRLFREGLRKILADSPFSIDQEASTLEEGLSLVADSPVDLVVFDPPDELNDLDEPLSEIRSRLPGVRIVVLTDRIRMERLADALSAGVDGYLLKDMSADALQHSLRLVLLGEKVFPTDLAHLLINGRIAPRAGLKRLGHEKGLSDRELQILGCLLNGDSNKLIANHLAITEGTVKMHIKAVLKKINVQNRTQAAIWALNNGIAANHLACGEAHD